MKEGEEWNIFKGKYLLLNESIRTTSIRCAQDGVSKEIVLKTASTVQAMLPYMRYQKKMSRDIKVSQKRTAKLES